MSWVPQNRTSSWILVHVVSLFFSYSACNEGNNRVKATQQNEPTQGILAAHRSRTNVHEHMVWRKPLDVLIQATAFFIAHPMQIIVRHDDPTTHSSSQCSCLILACHSPAVTLLQRRHNLSRSKGAIKRDRVGFLIHDGADPKLFLKVQRSQVEKATPEFRVLLLP